MILITFVLQEVVHGAQEAVRKVRDTAGDDLRVPVKRVETPFLSIRSKTVKELLAGGLAGERCSRERAAGNVHSFKNKSSDIKFGKGDWRGLDYQCSANARSLDGEPCCWPSEARLQF